MSEKTPFHPELARMARLLPRGLASGRWLRFLRILTAVPTRPPRGVKVLERELPGTTATVRILRPDGVGSEAPVLLWMHGGGYVVGRAAQDDGYCGGLAKRLGMVVVSVEYRLAPEHPWPAALDDCMAAFDLIHREPESLGVDPGRVVIGGRSAGGGLAASLVLRIMDSERPLPLLQLLVYPMLDDRTLEGPVDQRPMRLWDESSNRFGWSAYLGCEPGSPVVMAEMVPARREDFRGAPPTWIGVGSCDLFLEENRDYAGRLSETGVDVTLEVVPGAFHGFEAAVPWAEVSRRFIDAQVHAIEEALKS